MSSVSVLADLVNTVDPQVVHHPRIVKPEQVCSQMYDVVMQTAPVSLSCPASSMLAKSKAFYLARGATPPLMPVAENDLTPVPLSGMLMSVPVQNTPSNIHLCWMTPAKTFAPWRQLVVKWLLYHHPSAMVIIHSNTLTKDTLKTQSARVQIQPVDDSLFAGSALAQWWQKVKPVVSRIQQGQPVIKRYRYLYSHITDAMRLLLLWRNGGIYCDFDIIALKPLDSVPWNSIAFEGPQKINGAVAKFTKHHPFIARALDRFTHLWRPKVVSSSLINLTRACLSCF